MNEQDCYALEDLAQRWGCSVSDLVRRGAAGALQVCADVTEVGRGSGRASSPAKPEGQDPQPPGWDKLPRIRREREEGLAEFASNRERTTRATPRAAYVLRRCQLQRMAAPGFVALELEDALEFDGERWLKVEFWPPFEIGKPHLCVLAEEVARYERGLLGKPQAPGAVPAGAAQAQPEGAGPAPAKKWTAQRLAELAACRKAHGTKAAAERFGVSPARVRELLPSEKPARPAKKAHSVFTHRTK